jgi:Avidin family
LRAGASLFRNVGSRSAFTLEQDNALAVPARRTKAYVRKIITGMTTALTAISAAQAGVLDGAWWNSHCARIELVVSNSSVNGRYFPPRSQQGVELNGMRTGDLIAFIVSLAAGGPLVSWTGQHTVVEGENEKITSRWNMALDVPDEEETDEKLLQYVWTGSDTFVRTRPAHCS